MASGFVIFSGAGLANSFMWEEPTSGELRPLGAAVGLPGGESHCSPSEPGRGGDGREGREGMRDKREGGWKEQS